MSGTSDEIDLMAADGEAALEEIVHSFNPTPRFADVSFANYCPDPGYPSQRCALDTMTSFARPLHQASPAQRGFLARFRRSKDTEGPAHLYLDGGFGVGKTHLLAAAYHAAPEPKAYLSFAELTYLIGYKGMQASIEGFASHRLICIDEFELDDVGNTRMAATFLRLLMERSKGRARIVTTSNTLPDELGKGRFNAEEFQREIGEIAGYFQVVTIDGEDYRHRNAQVSTSDLVLPSADLQRAYAGCVPASRSKAMVSFDDLLMLLASRHPIQYIALLRPLGALFVSNLTAIEDQAVALRWVHFVDKLYDQQIPLRLSAACDLEDVFLPEYRGNGYRKKYRRALSRLREILAEPCRCVQP